MFGQKNSPRVRTTFISSGREVPSGKLAEGSFSVVQKCKYLWKLFMDIYSVGFGVHIFIEVFIYILGRALCKYLL